MKKMSRKLFIACLAVAFAVIALGTSTYAWLVVSRTASVEAFTGEVKAGDGSIEVSADNGATWKTSIEKDDFDKKLKNANFKNFDDVTYNGTGFKNITIDSVKKEATLSDIDASTEDKLAEAGILRFKFQIRLSKDSEKTSQKLFLDLANSKMTEGASNKKTWTPDKTVGTDIVKDTETSKFIVSNAARVMIKYGDTAIVLEKGANQEENTAGLQSNTDDDGAMGYLKARTGITSEKITAPGTYTTTAINGTTNPELGNVTTTATDVEVTVWLEGYDYDCINALYKQILSVSLGFVLEDQNA